MEEKEFIEEERKIERDRNNSMAILRDTMRTLKGRVGKALLDTEEEMKGSITEAYRLDREALKKKKERARRR